MSEVTDIRWWRCRLQPAENLPTSRGYLKMLKALKVFILRYSFKVTSLNSLIFLNSAVQHVRVKWIKTHVSYSAFSVGRLWVTNEKAREAAVNTTWLEALQVNRELRQGQRRPQCSPLSTSCTFGIWVRAALTLSNKNSCLIHYKWEKCCKWRNIILGSDPVLSCSFQSEIDWSLKQQQSSQPCEPLREILFVEQTDIWIAFCLHCRLPSVVVWFVNMI